MVDAEALADNVVIVLLAYIAAFLPWTIVSSTDFINSSWRPINILHRNAINNILFALIPAGYIIFYIVLQAKSQDFKEMFAAVVALLFSFLHAARSIMALFQLYSFRCWALKSISYLRAVGIHYLPKFQAEYKPSITTDEEIVQRLLINEAVIDNQLFHGPCRISFTYSFLTFQLPPSTTQKGFYHDHASIVFKVCLLPIVFFIDLIRHIVKGRKLPRLEILPQCPTDLWISWTTAFAAQGLQDWFQSLSVPENPDRYAKASKVPSVELYQSRRDFLAGQVLSSAALHFWPRLLPTADDVPTPMLWSLWPVSSGVANALPSKTDFLYYAMTNPSIFPYEYPHCDPERSSQLQRQQVAFRGYRPLARKMERFADVLPADFGDVDLFTPYVLEWLTIFLHLGRRILDAKSAFPSKLSPLPMGRLSSFRNMPAIPTNDDLDVAFDNLTAQLGFTGCAEATLCRVDVQEVLGKAALPFATEGFAVVADQNIVSWRVSELIDIWLAFLAGDQLTAMCKDTCPLHDGHIPMHIRMQKAHEEEGKAHVCSVDLGSESGQKDLETRRLERQFGCRHPVYSHMEQTFTFMGFGMECVRSRLATWVLGAGAEASREEVWKPKLQFRDTRSVRTTDYVLVGNLSEEMSTALIASGKELLYRRCVHVRLLWEVMETLKDCTQTKNDPSSQEVIMMCMLSFPSLAIEPVFAGVEAGSSEPSLEGENPLLRIDKPEVKHLSIIIEPRGAPQPFFLKLKVQVNGKSPGLVEMAILKKAGISHSEETFEWQLWRDTFVARLEALKEWQDGHNLPSVKVRKAKYDISEGMLISQRYFLGELGTFNLWLGWQPFRANMGLFELLHGDFLKTFSHTRDVTTAMRNGGQNISKDSGRLFVVSKTDSIPRDQLSKSCLFISELLQEYNENRTVEAVPTETVEATISTTIRRAKDMVVRGPGNVERALLFLESGAIGLGSAEVVIASVQFLIDGKYQPPDLRRAICMIDDHLNLFDGAVNKQGCNQVIVANIMKTLLTLYEQWLIKTGYNTKAVHSFCKFAGWMMWLGPSENLQRVVYALRRIFLRSRHYDTIHMLAIGKEIESLQMGNRSHAAEANALWLEYLQRAASEGGIPSASDSLSWFHLQTSSEALPFLSR